MVRIVKKNKKSTHMTWDVRADDVRRQVVMFHWFTFVLVPYMLGYGLHRYSGGSSATATIGLIEIVLGAMLIVNWLLYFVHRRIAFAKPLITISSMIISIMVQYDGGTGGSGAYWLFVFPPATFLFQGIALGLMYNILQFLGSIGYMVAAGYGLLPSFYSSEQMVQVWAVLILVNVLGYLATSAWERSRRTINDQRERLRVLLDYLPAGVLMVEAPDGKPSATNPSAERLLGRPIDPTAKQQDFADIYKITRENGDPYPSQDLPLFTALNRGEISVKNDIFVTRSDGTRTVLREVGAPIKDGAGRVTSAVAVFEDMTKEHEIDKMKTEFVSFASHQFKTPLTSIKWTVESLLGGDFGELAPGPKGMIQEVAAIAERMTRLVTDLLSVSRIDLGHQFNFVPKPTDVTPLVAEVLKEFAGAAGRQKIALVSSLPASLILDIDPEKTAEACRGLIGNAVKYSKEGGRIEVGLRRADKLRSILYFKDEGLGIPKDQQARVFGKFFRASNVAKDFEGTGLGLYIVKAIIEKQGGRIWFDSEEGVGTTFYVELPRATTPTG